MFATRNSSPPPTRPPSSPLLTLANTALASAERVAALNLNTARSVLEDGVSNTKALLGVRTCRKPSRFRPRWPSRTSRRLLPIRVASKSRPDPGRVRQGSGIAVRRVPEVGRRPAGQGCQVGPGWLGRRRRCRQVGHRCRQLGFRQHEQGCQASRRNRRSERRCRDQRHGEGCRRHRRCRQEEGRLISVRLKKTPTCSGFFIHDIVFVDTPTQWPILNNYAERSSHPLLPEERDEQQQPRPTRRCPESQRRSDDGAHAHRLRRHGKAGRPEHGCQP